MKLLVTILILLYCCTLSAQQPELVLPSGHTGVVRIAGFSPDNKYVITGGEDKTINIWETFTGLKLRTLYAGILPLKTIGFTPDGGHIYAQTDSSLLIWSTPSYRLLLHLPQTREFVISSDTRSIYSVDFKGSLRKTTLSGKQAWNLDLNGKGPISISGDN